ncbi:MAG TPA: DUF502 domain-containing protein [Holophaga sp.]|nr:DUF502 domain-containing protein [Holophaga sp.]
MLKRGLKRILATWLAGLLALLPLLLTAALIAWIANRLHAYLGPSSLVGQFLALFGRLFVEHPSLHYMAGIALLLAVIYMLGIAVHSRLHKPLTYAVEHTVRRIPVVGSLYNLAGRFVGLLDQKKDADIAAMSPVWCMFGGDGVAVLALRAIPDPIEIEGREYLAILVPTAPVPVGGGLLYVPKAWIHPANIGVDKLTSIYFSMGIIPPYPLVQAVQNGSNPQA